MGSSICLASSVGCAEGGRGIPISSLVVEMDLLLSRRLRLSNSCPSSPVPARWPALGRGGVLLYVCGMCVVYVWLIPTPERGHRIQTVFTFTSVASYENSKHDQRFRFSFFPLKVDLN